MKLTIKTLQQSTFKVEIELDKTVKELKDKIEKDHGKEYPNGAQKLIYSGKILADESKLSEYDIDEKKFVVLMITRPPPAQKPVAAEKPTVTKKDESAGAKSKVQDDKSKSTTATSTNTTSSATTTTTSTTAPPSTTTTQQSVAEHRPPARSSALNEATLGLSMSEPQIASRLASLMTQPHFRQIQDLIQQSPHLLSSTIEALASSDPEMYSFISENPDVFVSALNHPPLAGSRNQSSRSSTTSGQPARQGDRTSQQTTAPNPTSRQQPVVDQILGDVSEHDKEAIERLKELGFSEYLAVQAYMACDKDEQLAANLLFQMDQ